LSSRILGTCPYRLSVFLFIHSTTSHFTHEVIYIFNDTGFNKPFFSTYLKTSMFSLYLLGFIFWSPWRHQCAHRNHDESIYQTRDRRTPPPVPIFTLDQLASSVARDSDANAQLTHLVLWHYLPIQQARTIYNNNDEKVSLNYFCQSYVQKLLAFKDMKLRMHYRKKILLKNWKINWHSTQKLKQIFIGVYDDRNMKNEGVNLELK
ncbi:Solute carrier family 35 member F5-like 9, partial [Homarus americanus]